MLTRIRKAALPAAVYLLFVAFLLVLFLHPQRCSFEKNLEKATVEGIGQADNNQYIFSIEENAINQDDPFLMAEIRGWLVQKGEEYGKPIPMEILLSGKSGTFSVRLYREKRLDVPYLDQRDTESKDLYVGFLAKFPGLEVPKGNYKIGFLLEEDTGKSVLWTKEVLSVT